MIGFGGSVRSLGVRTDMPRNAFHLERERKGRSTENREENKELSLSA